MEVIYNVNSKSASFILGIACASCFGISDLLHVLGIELSPSLSSIKSSEGGLSSVKLQLSVHLTSCHGSLLLSHVFIFTLCFGCIDNKSRSDIVFFFLQHPDIVGEEEHCYTYHVIYNESYRVPMLFLHGCLRGQFPMSQLCQLVNHS